MNADLTYVVNALPARDASDETRNNVFEVMHLLSELRPTDFQHDYGNNVTMTVNTWSDGSSGYDSRKLATVDMVRRLAQLLQVKLTLRYETTFDYSPRLPNTPLADKSWHVTMHELGSNKLQVIKVIRDHNKLDLKAAKELSEQPTPCVVGTFDDAQASANMVIALVNVGASATYYEYVTR